MSKTPVLCIYHDSCFDGLVSAWVVRNWCNFTKPPSAEYIPAVYRQPPPDVTGKQVFIVDYSYDPEVLVELCKTAKQVVVIDHHETAILKIEKYFATHPKPDNLVLKLNMLMSGAGNTFEYLFPRAHWPLIVQYAQDYDLWTHKDPNSRAVMSYMGTMPLDFPTVDYVVNNIQTAIASGRLLVNKENEMVRWHLDRIAFQTIDGMEIPVVNAPHYIASWLADELCRRFPFAVIYSDTGDMRRYSFRSRKGTGHNVRALVEELGGGGHENAAGIELPISGGTDIQKLLNKARGAESPFDKDFNTSKIVTVDEYLGLLRERINKGYMPSATGRVEYNTKPEYLKNLSAIFDNPYSNAAANSGSGYYTQDSHSPERSPIYFYVDLGDLRVITNLQTDETYVLICNNVFPYPWIKWETLPMRIDMRDFLDKLDIYA